MASIHLVGEMVRLKDDEDLPDWARGQTAEVMSSKVELRVNGGILTYDLCIKLPPPSTMIRFQNGDFDLVPRHNELCEINSRYIEEDKS